jgi:hypothetical protein
VNATTLDRIAHARLANIEKTSKMGAGSQKRKNASEYGMLCPLVLPGFTLLEDGLIADGRPTLEQYAEVGLFVTYAEQASPFWLADWLAYVYFVRRADGTLELINGRHRVKAAVDLGWDAIPAQVGD